jgi:predicted nucleic acid-binding Zn ribbon protein
MLDQVLKDLGLGAAAASYRVGQHWKDAVGPEVAAHAWPEGLRGDTLEVSVDTSVWCQHLQLRRLDILAALAEVLGDEAPRDLRFRVGGRPAGAS